MREERLHPVVMLAALAVLLVSALGAAALTGWLPAASARLAGPENAAVREALAAAALPAKVTARTSFAGACGRCGVIESIRVVGVPAEAGAAYRITLRMDDGSYRTLSQPEVPSFVVGDRVRIANGALLERV